MGQRVVIANVVETVEQADSRFHGSIGKCLYLAFRNQSFTVFAESGVKRIGFATCDATRL